MDTNQQILGTAYINKLEQAAQSQTSFAQFDVLTPDEPIWAWQLVKRFLRIPNSILGGHVFHISSTVISTQFQKSDG